VSDLEKALENEKEDAIRVEIARAIDDYTSKKGGSYCQCCRAEERRRDRK